MSEKEPVSPKCFIIMPISVPPALVDGYHGGVQHFAHTLKHLFTPAVETAGFEAVRPKSVGTEVIHGDIIAKLQSADIVLCDMSALNANVFLELGVRSALNKPVCMVKDDRTPVVPFDASIVSYHTYNSALDPWVLESEVPKLADHITASAKSCAGKNPLWEYFGLTEIAAPPKTGSDADRLAFLAKQVERLSQTVEESLAHSRTRLSLDDILSPSVVPEMDAQVRNMYHVRSAAYAAGMDPIEVRLGADGQIVVHMRDVPNRSQSLSYRRYLESCGGIPVTTPVLFTFANPPKSVRPRREPKRNTRRSTHDTTADS